MKPIVISEEISIPGTGLILEKGDRLVCRIARAPHETWDQMINRIVASKPTKVWLDSMKRWYPIKKIYIRKIPHQVQDHGLGLYLDVEKWSWLLNPMYWIAFDPNTNEIMFEDETYKFA